MNRHLDNTAKWLCRNRGLLVPLSAAGLIFVLLVPLPPALLDVLLVGNLTLSALILLTTLHIRTPLEFSSLPSVLLGATLFRLVLNVASTRLILTAGEGGRALEQAHLSAGHVIWAFSDFVTRGSLEVGLILFAIIVAIQFVVVTKGATRISEVAARFVLDALPGKQMAIDAELSSGAITQEQATLRRQRVAQEADFYGAMDGASKFIRGDAIAALLIMGICIAGGMYIGIVRYGWGWQGSAELFSRLTIGDGLVTQIPAFITSIAAALLVTRSTGPVSFGEQVVGQLASRPVVLLTTAGVLGMLLFTALPKGPLLAIGIGCVGLAWLLSRHNRTVPQASAEALTEDAKPAPADKAENFDEMLVVDPLLIEVGYALVPLIDAARGGDLLERIATLRKRLAGELGLVVPPIRIRDNMRLEAHDYAFVLRGVRVAANEIYPRQLLAVGESTEPLVGRPTEEPTFGAPALWISPANRTKAQELGYAVVDPAGVLTTHLAETIRRHGADLLSREQVAKLMDGVASRSPSLSREVGERFKTGAIHKVLRALLRERVSIRDLETILEAMCDFDGSVDDGESLCEHVRVSIAPALSQQLCAADGKLHCVRLGGALEEQIGASMHRTARGSSLSLGAEASRRISQALDDAIIPLRRSGKTPVVLCSPSLRPVVRQLVAATQPDAAVLAYSEVESVEIETVCDIGTSYE